MNIFIVALLLLAVPPSTEGDIYYVKPDSYTSLCPEPCHTLGHYVQNTSAYFKSNTTFHFLSGHHTLSQTVKVECIKDLTLMGEETFVPGLLDLPAPSSQIYCNGSVGFFFAAMHTLFIGNLLFSGCGALMANSSDNYFQLWAALAVGALGNRSIYDVTIQAITVQNSTGYGILGNNIFGRSFIIDSTFILNKSPSRSIVGGNSRFVYMDCPVNSSATFYINSTNFLKGSMSAYQNDIWYGRATGIAITITPICSNLTIKLTNITADGNEGCNGGNMNVLYRTFDPTNRIIVSNSRFINGYAHSGGRGGGVNIDSQHNLPSRNVKFIDCTFENNSGTAVFLSPSSTLTFQGKILFRNNSGENGGALFFSENSQMLVSDNTTITFTNNSATCAGGAIWAPSEFITVPACFFQFAAHKNASALSLSAHNIKLKFRHNYAINAGSLLYGGAIDNCYFEDTYRTEILSGASLGNGVFNASYMLNSALHKSEVSSDPIGACFCIDNVPDYSLKVRNITKYPGEDFFISATTVGQRNGTVPGNIIAELTDTKGNYSLLGELQQTQRVSTSRYCANLTYTVFSNHETLLISLRSHIATTAMTSNFKHPILNITLQKCPPGFSLFNTSGRYMCGCAPVLKTYGTTCNITSKIIYRKPPVWIGYYNATGQKNMSGLLLHPHCPLDYCQLNDTKMNLSTPDKQCAMHRRGILCGACQPGLSLALGTSECLKCSNNYLALLLVFAVAGLGLVFLLFACNLTVTEGTLNGLIFYANIIWINRSIYFPAMATDAFTIFIAWLNLDLGIQTCFYNGLDTYAKVWLQFAFPFYIWLLVAAMTYLSHRFSRVAGLVGNNAVKVLSTLFLLSYAKLQHTIIAALSVTTLTYPDGSKEWLWLYDANVQYFQNKHIPLFISALLVLVLLAFPYTLLLFLIQWIRRIGGKRWKIQKWIAKLLPLFDAYTAPYKFQYQFWTGFLLLVRSILFLVFAVNYSDQASWNLVATMITCLFILTVAWSLNGVYQKKCLDILESSFLLNLGILSVVTLYYTLTQQGNQAAVMYTSVGAALIKFAVVVVYHFFWKTSVGKLTKKPFLCMANVAATKLRILAQVKSLIPQKSAALNYGPDADEGEYQPLLQSGNMGPGCYDQYREPWLEYIIEPDYDN